MDSMLWKVVYYEEPPPLFVVRTGEDVHMHIISCTPCVAGSRPAVPKNFALRYTVPYSTWYSKAFFWNWAFGINNTEF